MLKLGRLRQIILSNLPAKFLSQIKINFLKNILNRLKLKRSRLQYLQQYLQLILMNLPSNRRASNNRQIIDMLASLGKKLLDNKIQKFDAFLLDGWIDCVIEHCLEDLLEKFVDV